jgi:hypothetical protein
MDAFCLTLRFFAAYNRTEIKEIPARETDQAEVQLG